MQDNRLSRILTTCAIAVGLLTAPLISSAAPERSIPAGGKVDVLGAADLTLLALHQPTVAIKWRQRARLEYETTGDHRDVFAHHDKQLRSDGWLPTPHVNIHKHGTTKIYERGGYHLMLGTSSYPDVVGPATARIEQYGNVDPSTIPKPRGAIGRDSSPRYSLFDLELSIDEGQKAIDDLLRANGWRRHRADHSFWPLYLKGRVCLEVTPGQATAGSRWVYRTRLYSCEFPIPEDGSELHYSERRCSVHFESKAPAETIKAFYVDSLATTGWKHKTLPSDPTGNSIEVEFCHEDGTTRTLNIVGANGTNRAVTLREVVKTPPDPDRRP